MPNPDNQHRPAGNDKPIPTAAATPAVSCRGIIKQYRAGPAAVSALRGVDLDVQAGELLMLAGPSGCGKTTLLSVIAGILDRDQGECLVFGADPAGMDRRERAHWRAHTIGFVFQAYNLIPALTAAENVAIPLILNGERRPAAVRRAESMLERVGLEKRMHERPARLSGGQQQRVAIARALVHAPGLVLCDEPTSALDHDTGLAVVSLLRDVALQSDRAIIVVTHDHRIFSAADRIATMDDGRIIGIENATNGTPLPEREGA